MKFIDSVSKFFKRVKNLIYALFFLKTKGYILLNSKYFRWGEILDNPDMKIYIIFKTKDVMPYRYYIGIKTKKREKI